MKSIAALQPLGAHRLHIVTGKGGTGKSTVAAALAVALADTGQNVLFAETEQRQSIAALFGRDDMGYTEELLLNRASGGKVFGLAVEPEGALLDYLELFYNLRSAGSLLRRMGAISFATTVAPGLRDVLLTGKACEAVRRRTSGKNKLTTNQADDWVYDSVVLDAPPTGRIVSFLNVTAEVVGMAKVGPIRQQAEWVSGILRSPESCIHVVTTAEELPVQETLEAVEQLSAANFQVVSIVVNMTPADSLSKTESLELASPDVEALLGEQLTALNETGESHESKPHTQLLTTALIDFGRSEQRSRNDQADLIDQLRSPNRALIFLPRLGNAVGLTGVTKLAELLNQQKGGLG